MFWSTANDSYTAFVWNVGPYDGTSLTEGRFEWPSAPRGFREARMTDLVTGDILPVSVQWHDDKMIVDHIPIGSRPVAVQLGKRSRSKS